LEIETLSKVCFEIEQEIHSLGLSDSFLVIDALSIDPTFKPPSA
jgi:hypothetical protein